MTSRQHSDFYTRKAHKENFLARSIYKLEEIDAREKIFQNVQTVLDLGASPGSWTQYCLKRLPKGRIFAVDIAPLKMADRRITFARSPVEEVDWKSLLHYEKVDLVLCDMAPKTSGIGDRDVALSLALATLALESARSHLKPGGNFVVKLFMGERFEDFRQRLESHFATVKLLRPETTRKRSREIYFICKNFVAGGHVKE